MKAQIRGIDVNMRTFDYVFGAYLGELILDHCDNLSKPLQNPNLPAVNGRCTANATVETLKSIRNDESFDIFWEKVLTHPKRLDVNETNLPGQRSQPRSMQDYFEHVKDKEVIHTCPKDLYRQLILKPSIGWSTASTIALIRRISKCTHCGTGSYWKWQNTANMKNSWKK